MRLTASPGRDCIRAWESMPWVLQGSATPLQAEWLHRHLVRCAACRAEYAQQTRLRRAASLLPDIPIDANAGLARLLARLDAADAQPARVRPRARWLVRALAAAVLIQVVGIAALGTALWRTDTGAPYRTLSQPAAPAAPGAIRVVPAASLAMADWDALLRGLHLHVVNGPNSVGAYTVVPNAAAVPTQQAVRELRAARGIVLAEPIAEPP